MTHSGFTLIELSIVLVILGLIVGAIVGGQSLIKAAQLHSVTRELQTIHTMINAFQLEYNALPGDFNEGYDYFAGGSNTICGSDNTSETGCNGDDNGSIGYANVAYSGEESIRAWRHLTLAGLTEAAPVGNDYSCIRLGPGSPSCGISSPNVMLTKYRQNSGYVFLHPVAHSLTNFYGFQNTFVILTHGNGTPASTLGNVFGSEQGVLFPADLKKIDTKMDDGLPTLGRIFGNSALIPTLGYCTTPDFIASELDTITPSNTYLYDVSNSEAACTLLMRLP